MPTVLSPSQWQSKVNYDLWTDRFTPDDGVALHHGGGTNYPAGRAPYNLANEIAQLKWWEEYHLSKGWRGIGYGFGLGQTGTIFRCRGFGTYGAHTGDVDGDGIANNSEIVPVIWIASGNHHKMSDAAHDSLNWLRRAVIEKKSPKALYLYGHQELKGTVTSCPGPNGMDYVKRNRLALEPDMTPAEMEAVLNKFFAIEQVPAAHYKGMEDVPAHRRSRLVNDTVNLQPLWVSSTPEGGSTYIARSLADSRNYRLNVQISTLLRDLPGAEVDVPALANALASRLGNSLSQQFIEALQAQLAKD